MDKSLQQQLYGALGRSSPSGSNFSGTRAHLSGSSSVSSQNAGRQLFHGIAGGKNAYPLKKPDSLNQSSRYSVSGRTNQSIAGIRSEFNVVESYGFQLPVVVNEALTFIERNQIVSVKCAKNGWAWVVHGRRLLIWQYKDPQKSSSIGNSPPRHVRELGKPNQRRGTGTSTQCRELTLPHCDIGHKASLVSVFLTEGQQMASCIAVSPTGDVRYWTSIAHDGSSVDMSNILDGQEFDQLLEVPLQRGYMLVTTTCNLLFLQVQKNNGRHILHHKTIKQPSGFLGGFGKKFASIIIGMNNNGDKEHKFVGIGCDSASQSEAIINVLSDRWLQRWRLPNDGNNEQLIYEDCEIVRRIREEFQQKFWNMRVSADSVEIEMHLLYMQTVNDKIYILAGAVNLAHTPQMYYGMAAITSSDENMQLLEFIPLKLSQFYSATTEQECLSLRFIVSRTHIYLYTAKVVYPVHLSSTTASIELDAEKIEFHLPDDRILTAAVHDHIPLFFSRAHGLVSVSPSDFDSTDFLNMSACHSPDLFAAHTNNDHDLQEESMFNAAGGEANLHVFEIDPDDIYQEFKDDVSQLKAAFVYRLKRNNQMCNMIINDLLRNITETEASGTLTDAYHLDKIVITIAEDLAEDIPACDPRWEHIWEEDKSNKHALGSSSSLQILTQLKDKNMALRHFVEFLHSTGLWEKLNAVPNGGGSVLKPTCYVISDINEKIIAAIALRKLQNKYSNLLEETIAKVMTEHEKPRGNLTAQDLFYVKICKIQNIFQALIDVVNSRIEAQKQPSASAVNAINTVNEIVLKIITEVLSFREHNASIFSLPSDKMDTYEYLPWTAMSGNVGVRDSIANLIDISIRFGAHYTSDAELKQKIYQQLLEMIDIILDGRKNYMESVRDSEKYNVLQQQFESQRRDLISLLIADKQYELAAKLAEKYLDFQSLIIVCDETDNRDRLDNYIKKYEEYDFSQLAINWHLRQNRRGEVFERFKGNQAALAQFMRDHPTLGWIQLVFNGDFERAAKILFQLAQSETEFIERKKSMLSLAKLSTFAAADSDVTMQVENINVELTIIDYQEQLDKNVLQAYGYEVKQQKVLKVEEIINLFIADENETANEFDFRKALELLNFLEDPYDAKFKIWCAAILRDNWTNYDTNNAVDYIQSLLFFKLIEVCHLLDGECDVFLPPMSDFLETSMLNDLVNNKSFQYLLKLTYEYVTDAFKKTAEIVET